MVEEDQRHIEINREALFCSGTRDYRMPPEPDENQEVLIRFRAGRDNGTGVFLIMDDMEISMNKGDSDQLFDYYESRIITGNVPIRYYFRIEAGEEICFYNRLGPADQENRDFDFVITPGFHTPDWAKGAVMYQIFVDRFCNGDPSNDVVDNEYVYIGRPVCQVKDWNQVPSPMDVGRFYGGDLKGVWDKLDYLQSLGIEGIYFNPIFVSPSNHKYDCQDYEHIDPHFGVLVRDEGSLVEPDAEDNRDAGRYVVRTADRENLEASDRFFARFVEEAHRRGIKVILDGVFNHCGSFNKWLDGEEIYARAGGYEPGAFLSAKSPYRSFFHFHDQRDEAWPRNKSYDGWWGHETLPKLNYEESDKLVEYILNIARRWISPPFCVDGWRLDVAADLGNSGEYNHQFWRKFRQAVKEVNPDVLILAEHYGDPSSWLQGDQWDSVMNYDAFMEPVSWFLTGMEKHSDSFRQDLLGNSDSFCDAMRYHMASFYMASLQTAMNELDNHDHSRFLTRTNHRVGRLENSGAHAAEEGVNPAVMREAVVIQMTWPGAPTIYYGDEAGVCGFTDPDNRRTYPWGRENQEMLRFYREIIQIHKRFPVLRKGSVKILHQDYNLLVFGRFDREEQVIVAVNNRNERVSVEIPVWETGISRISQSEIMEEVFRTDAGGFASESRVFTVAAGIMNLELEAQGAAVFCHREEKKDETNGEGDAC